MQSSVISHECIFTLYTDSDSSLCITVKRKTCHVPQNDDDDDDHHHYWVIDDEPLSKSILSSIVNYQVPLHGARALGSIFVIFGIQFVMSRVEASSSGKRSHSTDCVIIIIILLRALHSGTGSIHHQKRTRHFRFRPAPCKLPRQARHSPQLRCQQ